MISVFNPPLMGDGIYDEDGSLPTTGDMPPGRGTMFVKSLGELRAAGREKTVAGGSAQSIRMLLHEDNVGFTLSDVRLSAGNRNVLRYKHHREANCILTGQGEVGDLTTGERWTLEPGALYAVDPEDRHSMLAHTEMHLISVFNPPLHGYEQHDGEGTLPPGMSR